MKLEDFVQKFAAEFDDTPADSFSPETEYKKLDEWSSLSGLAIISMVDDEFEIQLTGADLRSSNTIKDLFNLISQKK